MKNNIDTLKILVILFIAFKSVNMNSQNEQQDIRTFVRVFNFEGKKIGKGYVVKTTDSTLELSKSNEYLSLSIKNINYIKTKRSVGNNVLTGSFVGGAAGALIGVAASKEETKTGDGGWLFGEYEYTSGTSPGTGALIGGSIGLAGGALLGLGSSLFKKSETIIIEGDKNKWVSFRQLFE